MKLGGRIAAAIEVLEDVEARRRPAQDALKDWGLGHRFAGSGDRAAIGNLVFDALRRRASLGWIMASDTPRSIALAAAFRIWDIPVAELADAVTDRHGPGALTEGETRALETGTLDGAPPWVAGDYPEWLDPDLAAVFGDDRVAEGQELARRAPVDLRVNALKADRPRMQDALGHLGVEPTPVSPWGLRLPAGQAASRSPAISAEPGYRKGLIEIQDEGSQIAALLTGAAPGQQVADICAGGGGKTLALAAMLDNKGQIYAYDRDRRRLANIHDRLSRAGARNVQVRDPVRDDALRDLEGRMDVVVADAPCTGSGVWRRRPDAKWRLRQPALEARAAEQDAVLDLGLPLVRPGGRLVYITCSLLAPENDGAVDRALARHAGYDVVPVGEVIEMAFPGTSGETLAVSVRITARGLLMTPRRTGTDGFFVAVLRRAE